MAEHNKCKHNDKHEYRNKRWSSHETSHEIWVVPSSLHLPKFNCTYELIQNKSLMLWTQNLSSTQHYTEWNVLLARFKIIMNSETKEVIYDANNKQKVVELLHDFNQQSLKIWESVMSQYLKTHQFYVHLFEYLHKDLSN